MLAATDPLTAILGALGGVAALVVAINTWLMRKEAKKLREQESDGAKRMDTFEMSQASLREALTRSDTENAGLRDRVSEQDDEIRDLKDQVAEIPSLRRRITELETEVRVLKERYGIST